MTNEHEVCPPHKASGDSEGPLYQSLAALRGAHSALRRSTSTSSDQLGSTGREQHIRLFLTSACNAGSFISDANERRVAQSILDFWSTELTSSKGPSEEFTSALLAPFDATQTHNERDEIASVISKDDQHALIRLSALARQWENSNKQPGYLLSGEPLKEAARFRNRNANLDEFIKASEHVENARRRRERNLAYASVTVLAVLGCVGALSLWQFQALPQKSKSWIREIKETTSNDIQASALRWLKRFQPWLPPYDLSGTPKFANIRYPELKLNAPNFSGVEFAFVRLPRAQLSSASFNRSLIHIQNENPDQANFAWNDFSGAELKLSQFRGAEIITTSFAGADLYRAVFDRALLCDVNFSNADLQRAAFWGATLDDRTYGWLKKTAWWVATGWNSADYKRLLDSPSASQQDPGTESVSYSAASTEETRTLRQALRTSNRFRTDVLDPIANERPGSFERAFALNDMAWTLTTWGIDRDSLQTTEVSCNAKANPENALEAASEAICIVEDLKRKGGQDKDYDGWLSSFRDTQAYILMQADRMREASALYEKDIVRTEADGGRLFRYAISLFALKREDEANQKVNDALFSKQYLPTDELKNLKQYIPDEVRKMAYNVIDMAYPAPRPAPSCPVATK
jgi:Pentapeptide repeats (8 copies)